MEVSELKFVTAQGMANKRAEREGCKRQGFRLLKGKGRNRQFFGKVLQGY